MDAFTHAQYGWGYGLPGRSHFRRVAKAGAEDVRSMTLHRAGWPSDLTPPAKVSIPGDLVMTDNKPAADVTKDWQATQGQKSGATRLRLFAALSWIVAIGGEIAGIVLLYRHKFDHGNLPLLIGILVGIAIFAIAGNLLWKAANRHDPARASDTFRFFFQNQLGAIITLIAFLPLVLLIFTDKNMDPQSKKVAGGVGAVLAVIATVIGVSYNPHRSSSTPRT